MKEWHEHPVITSETYRDDGWGWYFGRRTNWKTVQFLLILGDQGDVGEGCEDEEEDFDDVNDEAI